MENNKNIKQGPFWEENSKLPVEEIKSKFPPKVAEVLRAQKKEDHMNSNNPLKKIGRRD